ncbi:MAG: pyrroline-5-carboxylate reductase [Flavobacteriales bacterium]|nr:pyrroline-5-carboxylate reductase [Flavobacteriales bacterium]
MKTLAIIGGGNLGKSILNGLLSSKVSKFEKIFITRRNSDKIKDLESDTVTVTSDNILASKNADVIILAIKPFKIEGVLEEIKPVLNKNQILISVVTGTEISTMKKYTDAKIYRAMPNTAIAIKESITMIAGSYDADSDSLVKDIFDQVGETVEIEEEMMGAATVFGASGIAFALRYLRAATQGGIEIGFSSKTSQFIAAQTVKGACELILQNGTHPEEEIDKVTTPRGVTISGLNEMEHQGFSSALVKGLLTSYEKVMKM